MQNNKWKIIEDQLTAKSPVELRENSIIHGCMIYLLSLWGIMGMDFGSGASVVGLEKIFRPPCLAVAAPNCWWHCAHLCHWAQFQHGWVFGGLFWVCGNIYKNNLGRVIASWLQIWQVYIYA